MMAFLRETLDTSFKSPEELEKVLQVPVLMSLPMRYTDTENKKRKKREVLRAASLAAGFVFSAVGIVLAVKGLDPTIGFIRKVLAEIGIV